MAKHEKTRSEVAREMARRPDTDPYEVLRVDRDASSREIKESYYELAAKYHPDHGEGNEDRFREVAEAYSVLSDPDKRAYYDEHQSAAERKRLFEEDWRSKVSERFAREYRPQRQLSEYTYIGEYNGSPHFHAEGITYCRVCGMTPTGIDPGGKRIGGRRR